MHSVELSENKIKLIRKLHQKKYRDKSGLFIAEGGKACEEILNSDIDIKEIITSEDFNGIKIQSPFITVKESVMKKIATTDSPCKILVLAEKKVINISKFKNLKKIALFDSISDPGNLGTILRSAAAFGVEGIILYGNCVDLYSPKVIRSCAGNFLKTPVISIDSVDELNSICNEHIKIGTVLSKTNNISIKEITDFEKYILMFGSEASGLQDELIKIADKNLIINIKKNVESLNLSVSSSIIFYELFINGKN